MERPCGPAVARRAMAWLVGGHAESEGFRLREVENRRLSFLAGMGSQGKGYLFISAVEAAKKEDQLATPV